MSADLVPVRDITLRGVRITSALVAYDVLRDVWVGRGMSEGKPVGPVIELSSQDMTSLFTECDVRLNDDGNREYFPKGAR